MSDRDRSRVVAHAIGYLSIAGDPFQAQFLGVVLRPARVGGPFVAMAMLGADAACGRCVGGAWTLDEAAEVIRRHYRYPSDSVCHFDGQYRRR
ncbi:MAG: hypothetical protein AAGJ46_20730 [Planctomycetota bacterium]